MCNCGVSVLCCVRLFIRYNEYLGKYWRLLYFCRVIIVEIFLSGINVGKLLVTETRYDGGFYCPLQSALLIITGSV